MEATLLPAPTAWARFWARRDPTPLVLLGCMAALWCVGFGRTQVERWWAAREMAAGLQAIAPLQVLVEASLQRNGSCPPVFIEDAARIDRRLKTIFIGNEVFAPHCNIQVDFKPVNDYSGITLRGAHLVLRGGTWICFVRSSDFPEGVPGCRGHALDLLPARKPGD